MLRPVEEQDLDYLLDLRWNKEVNNSIIHTPLSFQKQKKWYNNLGGTDIVLSVILKENSGTVLIGTTGLYDIQSIHKRAVWKHRIHPNYQKQGISFIVGILLFNYAFKTLNLNKIYGESLEENEGIMKLCQKLGFSIEGKLKEHYYHDGRYKDAVIVGLLKDEFYKFGHPDLM